MRCEVLLPDTLAILNHLALNQSIRDTRFLPSGPDANKEWFIKRGDRPGAHVRLDRSEHINGYLHLTPFVAFAVTHHSYGMTLFLCEIPNIECSTF